MYILNVLNDYVRLSMTIILTLPRTDRDVECHRRHILVHEVRGVLRIRALE